MNMESNPPRLPKTLNLVISLSDINFKGTNQNLHDLMVISVFARDYIIWNVLINEGAQLTSYMLPHCGKRKYLNLVLVHTVEIWWNFLESGLISWELLNWEPFQNQVEYQNHKCLVLGYWFSSPISYDTRKTIREYLGSYNANNMLSTKVPYFTYWSWSHTCQLEGSSTMP